MTTKKTVKKAVKKVARKATPPSPEMLRIDDICKKVSAYENHIVSDGLATLYCIWHGLAANPESVIWRVALALHAESGAVLDREYYNKYGSDRPYLPTPDAPSIYMVDSGPVARLTRYEVTKHGYAKVSEADVAHFPDFRAATLVLSSAVADGFFEAVIEEDGRLAVKPDESYTVRSMLRDLLDNAEQPYTDSFEDCEVRWGIKGSLTEEEL